MSRKQDLDDISITRLQWTTARSRRPTSSFDDSDTAFALIAGLPRSRRTSRWRAATWISDTAKYRGASNVFIPCLGPFPARGRHRHLGEGPVRRGLARRATRRQLRPAQPSRRLLREDRVRHRAWGSTRSTRARPSRRPRGFLRGRRLGYRFTDSLAASPDYTRFKGVGDENETGEGDITSFRLGLIDVRVPLIRATGPRTAQGCAVTRASGDANRQRIEPFDARFNGIPANQRPDTRRRARAR